MAQFIEVGPGRFVNPDHIHSAEVKVAPSGKTSVRLGVVGAEPVIVEGAAVHPLLDVLYGRRAEEKSAAAAVSVPPKAASPAPTTVPAAPATSPVK